MHNFLSILTLIFQFLFLLIFKLLSSLSESRVRLWNVWIKFYGWPHFVSLHHLRNQNSWIPGFCTCFPVSHKFDNFIIHCQSHASGYGSKACFIYQRKNLRFFWHKYFDGVSLCTFCQMLLVHYGSSSCLLSKFHLNDNFKLDRNDKLYKLCPLIDHLNKKFISCRTPLGTYLCRWVYDKVYVKFQTWMGLEPWHSGLWVQSLASLPQMWAIC